MPQEDLMAKSPDPGGFQPIEVPVRDQTTLPGFRPIEVDRTPRPAPAAPAPHRTHPVPAKSAEKKEA